MICNWYVICWWCLFSPRYQLICSSSSWIWSFFGSLTFVCGWGSYVSLVSRLQTWLPTSRWWSLWYSATVWWAPFPVLKDTGVMELETDFQNVNSEAVFDKIVEWWKRTVKGIITVHITKKSVVAESYEGRRPLGRPRRRWEDNIKMDLREVGLGGGGHGLDQSGLGWGQVASSCECGYEPSGSIKCGEFLE
jgi:hypothetical protein